MRVLFLDDDDECHRKMRDSLIGTVAVHVQNYEEAVAALSAAAFDVVYLDFDLPLYYLPRGLPEKTGADVAKFIAGLPSSQRPRRVVIHSVNKDGAQRIAQELTNCAITFAPFPTCCCPPEADPVA